MALVKTSKNPEFALTPEKYSVMLKHYLDTPTCTIKSLMTVANVGRIMAKRAMTLGWPELNLPPLPAAKASLVDPQRVHEEMAQLQDVRKEIQENLFGPVNYDNKMVPAKVVQEATVRAAEHGMASRSAVATSVKTARLVEKLAEHFTEMFEAGEIEFPEKLRPEHVMMLAKMADAVNSSILKATQAEKLANGQPDEVAGTQVTNLLIGATLEELQEVVIRGKIPNRLLGLPDALPKTIDVDVVDVTPEDDPWLDKEPTEEELEAFAKANEEIEASVAVENEDEGLPF